MEQKQTKNNVSISLNGCLWFIVLCALVASSVKGCKMVNMKYEEKKIQHEMYMDSINRVKRGNIEYRGK